MRIPMVVELNHIINHRYIHHLCQPGATFLVNIDGFLSTRKQLFCISCRLVLFELYVSRSVMNDTFVIDKLPTYKYIAQAAGSGQVSPKYRYKVVEMVLAQSNVEDSRPTQTSNTVFSTGVLIHCRPNIILICFTHR